MPNNRRSVGRGIDEIDYKYIVNVHGVTHSVPAAWPLKKGERLATDAEIDAYETPTEPAPVPASNGPSLEVANAIAEKDTEIARLTAELATAKQAKATK